MVTGYIYLFEDAIPTRVISNLIISKLYRKILTLLYAGPLIIRNSPLKGSAEGCFYL